MIEYQTSLVLEDFYNIKNQWKNIQGVRQEYFYTKDNFLQQTRIENIVKGFWLIIRLSIVLRFMETSTAFRGHQREGSHHSFFLDIEIKMMTKEDQTLLEKLET